MSDHDYPPAERYWRKQITKAETERDHARSLVVALEQEVAGVDRLIGRLKAGGDCEIAETCEEFADLIRYFMGRTEDGAQ